MDVDVLILSSLYDFSTDLVCEELRASNTSFVRINRETLPNSQITLDPTTPFLNYAMEGAKWRIGPALKSVWYRQPIFLRNTPGRALSVSEQLDNSQWPAFLRGLMCFDHAQWMNHPQASYLAESKPYQLRLARELGFQVPQTVITNDPDAIRRAALGNPFILKSVDTVLLREGDEEIFAYSCPIDMEDCQDVGFSMIPATCQTFIRDKKDLRVTVIDESVFCVAITDCGIDIEGDWRLRKKDRLQYDDYPLSADDRLRCVAFVKALGLRFGAIDLAATADGVYFLEINPTGEWGWIDSPERCIAKTIAASLRSNSGYDRQSQKTRF